MKPYREKPTCSQAHSGCTTGRSLCRSPADYKGVAGSRYSLVVYDEIWGFESEKARRLYEEPTPLPTESSVWILIVTYAGFLGESDLLESIYQRGLSGRRVDKELECHRADELFMFW